jgi:hypothetical protein
MLMYVLIGVADDCHVADNSARTRTVMREPTLTAFVDTLLHGITTKHYVITVIKMTYCFTYYYLQQLMHKNTCINIAFQKTFLL